MANIKSKKKSIRKIAVRTARNRQIKSRLKTLLKKILTSETPEAKKEATSDYFSALDKAQKKGVIHKNRVARHKSKFSQFVFSVA